MHSHVDETIKNDLSQLHCRVHNRSGMTHLLGNTEVERSYSESSQMHAALTSKAFANISLVMKKF